MSTIAKSGLVDAAAKKLALWDGVSVYSDSGYEIHTNEVRVDLANGIVHGEHMVTGQGPQGVFSADRFRVDRQNKLIFLMGHVHMTVDTGAMRQSSGKKHT